MIWNATLGEHPQLLSVQKLCVRSLGGTYSGSQIQRWVDYLDGEGSKRYRKFRNIVWLKEGNVVGFCSWLMKFGAADASIECLYVLPDFRSEGIGASLLLEAESRLPSGTVISVRSTLNAQSFYEQHGYRLVGDGVSRAGFAVKLMEKPS